MSDARALAEIKRLASLGRVDYPAHALERMDERGVERDDVIRALLTASRARWQSNHGTWCVEGGIDRAGDDLTVIVVIEADLVVITVF